MTPGEKHKFAGVNVPSPAMGGAPNFVVAVIGNKLAGTPPMLVTGAMLCSRCLPAKQVPSFTVKSGESLCPECLAKPDAGMVVKTRVDVLFKAAVEFVDDWKGEPCSGDENNCKHCLALRTDVVIQAMVKPGQDLKVAPKDPEEVE